MRYDELTLPQLMLLWGAMKAELEEIEALVKGQVLQLKQTQVVHNIRATFGKGKGSYDHQAIAEGMDAEITIITAHTRSSTVTDWKGVCDELEQKLTSPQRKGKLYELRDLHFTPGKEQVRISFEKQDKKKNETGAES